MSTYNDPLAREKSSKRAGTTSQCLQLRDFFAMTISCTPYQASHIKICGECRKAFNNFYRIKRNEARMHLKLPAWEDLK